VAGGEVVMAEPDLEQSQLVDQPAALGIAGACDAVPPDSDVYAIGNTNRGSPTRPIRSSMKCARVAARSHDVARQVVRIAHLDTGYDDGHAASRDS
jgi:hypothetical protein